MQDHMQSATEVGRAPLPPPMPKLVFQHPNSSPYRDGTRNSVILCASPTATRPQTPVELASCWSSKEPSWRDALIAALVRNCS